MPPPQAPPAAPATSPAGPIAPAPPPPKPFRILLSCVADEFLKTQPNDPTGFQSYRDYLARELAAAAGLEIILADEIAVGSTDRLQALDEEIARCDLVLHLVGDMPGEAPSIEEVARLLKRRPTLFAGKRALAARLQETTPITYTQWACYLAWEDKTERLVLYAAPEALRSPAAIQEEILLIQQFRHRQIIASMAEPWSTFRGHDHLCRKLWLNLIRRSLVPRTAPAPNTAPTKPASTLTPRTTAEAVVPRLKTTATFTGAEGYLRVLLTLAREHGVVLQRIVQLLDTHLTETQQAAAENSGVPYLQNFAFARVAAGEFETAMETATEAADLAERLMESDPENAIAHRQAVLDAYTLMSDAALAACQPQAAVEALVQGNRLISLPNEPLFWADYHCRLADLFLLIDRPHEAEPYITTIATLREKLGGETHPKFAEALTLHARLHHQLRQWPELATVARRIIRIQNTVPAPRRTLMPQAFTQLSTALLKQGLLDEAEPVLRQSLALHEQTRGPAHPETIAIVNNLAGVLHAREALAEAEPLYRRALAGFEQVHGPDHPETLACLGDFVELLNARGDLAAAESLCREALTRRERTLGPDHPDTLASLNNLAYLLRSKGDLAAAEPLFRRALETCERVLGPNHPDTLGTVHNFAGLLDAKGDLDTAEPLLRRAVAGREKALGPEHAKTLGSLNNLARLLHDKGNPFSAEPLAVRAFEGARKTFGPNHPNTKIIEENLADIRRSLAGKSKAIPVTPFAAVPV